MKRTETGGKTWERVIQNFEPVCDKNSRVLILGTAPSRKSREAGFYYGHPQNRFWRMLAAVAGEETPRTTEEKMGFLLRNKIALHDVIHSCDIIGSSDSSIRNVEPADLGRILAVTGKIPVFCNGGTAYRLYQRYQAEKTGIPAVQMPSTSPANAAWRLDRLIEEWGRALLPYIGSGNL